MTTEQPENEGALMEENDDQPVEETVDEVVEPEPAESTVSEEPVPPASAAPASTSGMDAKNKAVFAHLSAFLTFVGIPAPIGPLVAWLILKDQDAFAADQAREALNFNLSFLIYAFVAGISLFVLVGFVLLPVVLILWFIFPIMAAVAASRGEYYRYPLTIRMVS